MKYQELKKILTKSSAGNYRSLSNLYKDSKSARICIGLYESQGYNFRKYYLLHLELDYSGKILAIKDDFKNDEKLVQKYKKLIGKQLDMNSLKWDYQKIVHNRPVGVESSHVVGVFNSQGKFILYNKKNVGKIVFSKQYKSNGDKLVDYGGYELTEEFLQFVKNYKKQITNFSIYSDGITFYRVSFKMSNLTVQMELQQFFNYNLKVNIYHPQKGVLTLEGEEIKDFAQKLQELKLGRLTDLTKVQMATRGYGTSYCNYENLGNKEFKVTIKFDGYDQRPKGKYNFIFDLKNNKVQCLNGNKSQVFIPKQIQKYQNNLKLY